MFIAPDPISFAIAMVVMVVLAGVGIARASKVNSLLLTIGLNLVTFGNWFLVATKFDTHGLSLWQYVAHDLWWVAVLGFITGASIGLWAGLGRSAAARPAQHATA
jgi:hypothetical protein